MISPTDYCVLRELDDRWRWIIRDEHSQVFVSEDKPSFYYGTWDNGDSGWMYVENGDFDCINWLDEEPYYVPDLIKEYEGESEETGVKDIEWLKEEMDSMHRKRDIDRNPDEWFISKTALLKAIDQLDELEVLSSDWIKDNQLIWTSTHGSESYIPSSKLYGKIVPKQE